MVARPAGGSGRSFARHLVTALVVAAAVRGIAVLIPVDPFVNPDAFAFRDLARSLAQHGRLEYVDQGAPDLVLRAFRSLLYPIFLAPFLAAGPLGLGVALLAQAALGLLTVACIALLARTAYGDRTGSATAWIGAAYWTSCYFERQVTSEALFTPLLALGALGALRARNLPGWLLTGACFGLAALTRPAGVIAGIGAALAIACSRQTPRRVRAGVAILLGLGLVLTPALLRNRQVVGSPVLLTSGGMNFWIGNGRGDVAEAWRIMARDLPRRGEVGMDRWFYRDTREHLGEILRNGPRLLSDKLREFISPAAREGWYLPYRFLWPFALLGLFWPRASGRRAGLILGAMVWAQVALALATVPWARYRAPLEPFLWPAAAAAVDGLWRLGPLGRVAGLGLLLGNGALLAWQLLR